MKKAKKVFAILTALTLICCVFAGCDSNETPDTTENNSANANAGTEVYKIGIVQLVEHVALDTATEGFNKVLDVTEEIVKKNNLTTIMITHNMSDALRVGNRLVMMNNGKIIFDVSGEEQKKFTTADLLEKFKISAGEELNNDRMLLS